MTSYCYHTATWNTCSIVSNEDSVLNRATSPRTMMLRRDINMILLLALIIISGSTACVFDCRYDSRTRPPQDDGTICAGPPVELETINVANEYMLFHQFFDDASISVSEELSVLNLAARSISSIAPHGFECYTFIPYIFEVDNAMDQLNTSADTNLHLNLRGVNLDDNDLTVLPAFSLVGLENVTYFTAAANSISQITDVIHVNMVLIVILDGNQFGELPAVLLELSAVTDFSYRMAIASFESNHISEIPIGFFNFSLTSTFGSGTYTQILLSHNEIRHVQTGFLKGGSIIDFYGGSILIDFKFNQISEVEVGLFELLQDYATTNIFIDLSYNQIRHVPQWVFNSTNTGLNSLILHHNNITQLNTGVFYSDHSEVSNRIDVSFNQITQLNGGVLAVSEASDVNLCCQTVELVLEHNQVTRIGDDMFTSYGFANDNTLYAGFNNITYLTNHLFPLNYPDSGNIRLYLNDNNLSRLDDVFLATTESTPSGVNFIVDLSRNNLISLPQSIMEDTNSFTILDSLNLTISENQITSIPYGFFNSLPYINNLIFDVNYNNLTYLDDGLFNITLPNANNHFLRFSAAANQIESVGEMFNDMTGFVSINVLLPDNQLKTADLQKIFNSCDYVSGTFLIDLEGNDIDSLPPLLLNRFGSKAPTSLTPPNSVHLLLGSNRIENVSDTFFGPEYGTDLWNTQSFIANFSSLLVDLSDNPNLKLPEIPFYFGIENFEGATQQITNDLVIIMQRTGQQKLSLNLFGGFGVVPSTCNAYEGSRTTLNLVLDFSDNNISPSSLNYMVGFPFWTEYGGNDILTYEPYAVNFTTGQHCNVQIMLNLTNNNISIIPPNSFGGFYGSVDLSRNQVTSVIDGAFEGSYISALNFSNNRITSISSYMFNFSMHLNTLDLSNNVLTSFPLDFATNTPILRRLSLKNNNILAIPELGGSNRIFDSSSIGGNPLSCVSYIPAIEDCSCAGDMEFSRYCGYGRCTNTSNGCQDAKQRPLGTCSQAPESVCISKCPDGQYLGQDTLAEGDAACAVYTNCLTAFGLDPGYEFAPPTTTTDRLCAPCSVCPEGFDTKPCTSAMNTICTKTDALTSGDLSAIALSLVLVFALGVGGTSYVFLRKQKLGTERELEMSQLLLGEVTDELGEVAEDNERMRQAWEIQEKDVTLDWKLAEGSFGEVWAGKWGHIGVAVKLLHSHFAASEEDVAEFNREATFMQTIKHPNILIFHGAGVRQDERPFLVVEIMSKGSMRTLVKVENLEWSTRRRFAREVALGMAHLHGLGSMHRDLKSDNCLVDGKYHVKVGDFGNSRLKRAYRKRQMYGETPRPSWYNTSASTRTTSFSTQTSSRSASSYDWADHKSLTTGVGTPLWMAPELICGENDYGNEVDVYSYGIVMWELLTCETPWESEIADTRSHHMFRTLLTEALLSGKRPSLPAWSSGPEYDSFVDLMKRCWETDPVLRPTFAEVVREFKLAVQGSK